MQTRPFCQYLSSTPSGETTPVPYSPAIGLRFMEPHPGHPPAASLAPSPVASGSETAPGKGPFHQLGLSGFQPGDTLGSLLTASNGPYRLELKPASLPRRATLRPARARYRAL